MRLAALCAVLLLFGCTVTGGRGTPKIIEEASNEHPSKHVYCMFEGVQWSIFVEAPRLPCAQMGEVVKAE